MVVFTPYIHRGKLARYSGDNRDRMPTKREISPAINLSADQYVSRMPQPIQGIVATIRAAKETDSRPWPSSTLIDYSNILTPGKRVALLNKAAELVDENVAGRSDMCLQFAALLNLSFRHLGFDSRAVSGTATYLSPKGKRVFAWHHAWVRIGREVIDGNTDSLPENIMVPDCVKAAPYWGPIKDIPGRTLKQDGYVDDDPDVSGVWWPDLKEWLETDFLDIE